MPIKETSTSGKALFGRQKSPSYGFVDSSSAGGADMDHVAMLDILAQSYETTVSIEDTANTSGSGARVAEAQSSDYRVAVFGAGGVGKSSIVQRFVKGTFSENYVPTIEDTYRQVISCNQKNVCTLQITDTTGSHQFPAMQRLSISKGHAFVLIYSVTRTSGYAHAYSLQLRCVS
ncbi:hypothetical protein Y032_0719g1808 [Ancylostoma ceylanicum]|uniref:Ras family protein n=2 Tax=Ancylostoma ceylanicum TaxID=53326 RepID=A0A016WEY8_9BILA|nr:hypothetical protein Y032_0719g1808 [Ancylostoma ceylanicum]